jgi:hypothetical protein
LLYVVDDYQWLDTASTQALAFATRVVGTDLSGLPELPVQGLRAADAEALLDTVLRGPVDSRVRHQIIAEARGNPLAVLELPRGLTPTELVGGFGLPGTAPQPGSIEECFARRVDAIPDSTRRLLLIAASDPSGDPTLVWRAAAWLGIEADTLNPAVDQGLVEMGTRTRFRHPLVRSAIYRSASPRARRQAHRALAEVTDPELDPDRRAWRRAQAVSGPVRWTPVLDLLSMAEVGPITDYQHAQADLVRLAERPQRNSSRLPPQLAQAAQGRACPQRAVEQVRGGRTERAPGQRRAPRAAASRR